MELLEMAGLVRVHEVFLPAPPLSWPLSWPHPPRGIGPICPRHHGEAGSVPGCGSLGLPLWWGTLASLHASPPTLQTQSSLKSKAPTIWGPRRGELPTFCGIKTTLES